MPGEVTSRTQRNCGGEVPLRAGGEEEMVNAAVGRERPDRGRDTGRDTRRSLMVWSW